jgi:F-type H+-transporting ATPase subunit gamma
MPSLKDIRQKIASTKNTQQITRAMKMVSAAKLRRAQDQIVNMRPYANQILAVISDIATTQRVSHPLLNRVENPQKILMVVLTSDRGLCGGFNNSVNRFTEKWLNENRSKYKKIDFIFIGRKGADYFKRRGVTPIEVRLNLARENSYELASAIAKQCMEHFISGGYDEIRFVNNEFISAISQNLVVQTLLPIDVTKTSFVAGDGKKSGFSKDLIFEPSPEEMLVELLTQNFAIQVFKAMSESVAAEHAARMTAMENATKNAKEMINSLTLTYNKLRQASITRELIEICSGAEAVNNG